MKPRTLRVPALALSGLAALALVSLPAQAEKPEWSSMAELLVVSIGESDAVGMSQVMSRCTALNITLAGMLSEYAPDMSAHYEEQALSLMQHGVLIDSQLEKEATGFDADISALSMASIEKVRGLLAGYSEWLDANMEDGGTYFNDEIEMEMNSCNLAAKFVTQMSAG